MEENKYFGKKINEWTVYEKSEKKPSKAGYYYRCVCKCGFESFKTLNNIKKSPQCRRCCSSSFSYLGKRYNSYTVINNPLIDGTRKLEIKCDCGNLRYIDAYNIEKLSSSCRFCQRRKSFSKIGTVIGNFKVLEILEKGSKKSLKVKCLNCQNEFFSSKGSLYNRKFCGNCPNGFYPGKFLDGNMLIERIQGAKWKIKCRCGNIFETTPRKHKGLYTSCGCRKNSKILDNIKKKIGLKFFYLKIIGFSHHVKGHYFLELKCKCGNKIFRPNGNEFKSRSCGCLRIKGNVQGEKCSFSKLKSFEVISLRNMYESGEYSIKDLCEIFHFSRGGINKIINRETWKMVK